MTNKEKNSMNDYTMVSLATDIYRTIDMFMPEQHVDMNINIIPDLCNLMFDMKTARVGAYLGVKREISLMMVDDKPHLDVDIDIKFYKTVVSRNNIPFLERHVTVMKHDPHCDAPYLDEVLSSCKLVGFIID